ncbi:hypothetical protein SAMN02982929_05295 [Saccharopolyspora kobensis]|uniref:Uncharacterized protein n=1 Tax=Saccharopolyspora kobensis TaxID=146035 RepID=A0A1H6DZB4_9PSEU|nr:hypothetical protein [Saccharopolyspora kobensis]SEG90700.1 hypothetical protein SAMN02982929_05295 [Saccharopolyspora kobensis]SFD93295.1 hypothetical protein SAMN05216506_107271 [Saccharopolyspora kobensis]
MSPAAFRRIASIGILIALASAAVYYTVAPPRLGLGVVGYLDRLGPLLPGLFGATAVFVAATLVVGRWQRGAHIAAAGCMSFYAAALWATAFVLGNVYGVVGAGLATSIAIHALLLANAYPRGGSTWTRR